MIKARNESPMGLLGFLSGAQSPAKALARSEAALKAFETKRAQLEAERQQKLQRQVELWSVLTPSPEMEADYRKVSTEIAELITKVQVLDEHVKKIRLATFHCREQNDCVNLNALLKASDPSQNAVYVVPEVDFKAGTVKETA